MDFTAEIKIIVITKVGATHMPVVALNIDGEIPFNDWKNEKVLAAKLRKMADDIETGCGFMGVKYKETK